MNTEIADTGDKVALGWVCYDADCPVCRRWAGKFDGFLKRNGFRLVPLQAPEVRRFLSGTPPLGGSARSVHVEDVGLPHEGSVPPIADGKLLEEMRVITREGNVFGGADAIVYLAKVIPNGGIFYAMASLPGIPPILRAVYRWIARNRTCDGGACNLPRANARRNTAWLDALPLFALTAIAFAFGHQLPAWAWMWTICFALFFGCKWLVFRAALRRGEKPGFARAIGFLFGWVGMDAKAFFNRKAVAAKPRTAEWLFTIAKMLIGAVVVWSVARRTFAIDPLLAGWIAMVGLMPLLHFGFFELLALAWRKTGVAVTPLMLAPIKAHSLADFWGRRWNTGFHQLTEDYAFNPTRKFMGARLALLFAFLLSGLLHDVIISVPARGGHGLPTIYFLIQGAGVLFERTAFARRWGVGRGWRGWLFTMIVTAGPAFWLFHPAFVRNVMIPFLQTLNAL